ncbi:hypothetical protein BDN70DRAFT_875847 [Pholiota conissans]|uniref:Uncharacterized protein n=1 Tax=Pholiota conissans TaxID=109636 RepID=A0A9P5Z8E1_9AGAR|nr:hypothetical protein BDN70DRAFT_875847 [Pholiota conissans]
MVATIYNTTFDGPAYRCSPRRYRESKVFQEEVGLEELAKLFPNRGRRRPRRLSIDSDGSICSDASWGSDIAAAGCDCPTHNDEELEVAKWLLLSREEDLAIRPPPATPSQPISKSEPSFVIYHTPGALFLQIVFAILTWLGIISNEPLRHRHLPYPHQSAFSIFPRQPRKFVPFLKSVSWEYLLDDDIEYLIPPTPGTDQKVLHISVSNRCDYEAVKQQALAPPHTLRIYRVPNDKREDFVSSIIEWHLAGHVVRKPRDIFDTVKVLRQSNVSWELGGEDQSWILIGRDPDVIDRILTRIDERPINFSTWVKRSLLKLAYNFAVFCFPNLTEVLY